MKIYNKTIQAVLAFMIEQKDTTNENTGVTVQEIATGIGIRSATIYRVIRYWYVHPEILPGVRECVTRRVGFTRYIKQYYFTDELNATEIANLDIIPRLTPNHYQISVEDVPPLYADPNDNLLPEALRTEPNQKDSDNS